MFKSILIACLFVVAVTAHLRTGDEAARYFPSTSKHSLMTEEHHWTYSRVAEGGVHHWGDDNPACLGQRQSPIDLKNAVYKSDLSSLNINWKSWPQRTMINTGHAIQVNENNGVSTSTLSGGPLDGQYRAIQFHAHAVSEHTVNGAAYPVEIHVVHQNADPAKQDQSNPSELAVIGLFFEEGEHNEALENFFEHLESIPKKDNATMIDLNLFDLLPSKREYYTYPGSLTTPGCRETVTWIVMKEVQQVSGAQIEHLREVMHLEQNNRPVQPLHGRVIHTNSKPMETGNGGGNGGSNVNINFANIFQGLHVNN